MPALRKLEYAVRRYVKGWCGCYTCTQDAVHVHDGKYHERLPHQQGETMNYGLKSFSGPCVRKYACHMDTSRGMHVMCCDA